MITVTSFKSLFDNQTNNKIEFDTFDKFEKTLYKLSEVERKSKRDAFLISPAKFVDGTTRANRNVIEWGGWAAVDVDDHEFKGDLKNELASSYGDYYYICYSTASSTDSFPKFRLVFPLKSKVEASRIKHFWYALNTHLGSIGDKQTKDLSRMYYIPATYSGANNFIFTNVGSVIDPNELCVKYPFNEKKVSNNFIDRLPDEWQKQIIEHRKSQLENVRVFWTGYRDCPFVNKKLIDEYKSIAGLDGTGRYSMIYKIMLSIASSAIKREYPITENEIVTLILELDRETANRYQNRPLAVEASRAIEYAYRSL
ncbi:MAG: hypothetical protein EBZ34_01260 [Flavobacteriia bacterium]|nr:hypothetical protein [Flavobacteriia bacterium]